jgi:hypothetical protein
LESGEATLLGMLVVAVAIATVVAWQRGMLKRVRGSMYRLDDDVTISAHTRRGRRSGAGKGSAEPPIRPRRFGRQMTLRVCRV